MLVSRRSRVATLAACVALLLSAGACGTEQSGEADTQGHQVRLYGNDGNMLNTFPRELKDRAHLVDGMKGTTPMTPLPEDFKARLRAVDPELRDYLYAAEAYDAVMISALAAQLAGTTAPAAIAKQIVGVTNEGQRCEDAVGCLKLARTGQDIEYRGISLTRAGFTDAGEPATASYGTLHFDDQKLNDAKTEFVGAGDDSTASTKAPPKARKPRGKAGAPLTLGGLMPRTGALSLAYPPQAAAAALAVKEINAAGGVLGEPVVWIEGDDGTNPDIARATLASHVRKNVHVIIGAGASGVSKAILPDVVAAGLVMFSPANTDASLTTIEDNGLYFRTAPPDSLQGRALADVILRDGPRKVALVARKDSYGEGLQGYVRTELERAGLGSDKVKLLTYEPPANADSPPVDFSRGAREIKEFGADAVLLIGYAESAAVIVALDEAGVRIQQ
ncbi:ABC transporter substrate-binding protein [Micromonospora sagamiensis]|uniref:Amino acid/amide ABC transporter substrate-binding protein, HAAT family (TC 3.A.1.4.-) n=1 Tax=Micromonospora sagamiensis TaxID=47875 RepID=A0A562WNU9_9ACTN|nr:ABC transporter substrate-binding protein [Micromonospora sagamiensis]TWJ31875.1 amino acid/amide ABC transporter substrate-binding protein, HAAT family (TC 3.A.1.4.-) [Micromonospora sagamiensis]